MRLQYPLRVRLSPVIQAATLLCVLLVHKTYAERICKRGCPESDNGFLSYTPGNVYEYNLDSIMTVALNDASDNADDTNLKITGNAKLFSEGNCGYTLQLGAIKVTAVKKNIEKKIMQSILKPVHFTMVSGKVDPELCADKADNAYALNVKRAVISMLQSKPDTVQEIDIFGQCLTHTSVTKVGDVEVINKVRDLDTCGYRQIINSGILTNALQTRPGLENNPVLKADFAKETKIEKGVVNSVQVVEEYKYTPISKPDVGIRVKVVTNLRLRNSAGVPAQPPATGSNPTSIMFQQPDTYTSKNIAALKNSLSELVQLLDGFVKQDSSKHFMELIRLMRNSDTDTLLELSTFPLQNKVLARKVYLDALFRTATSESARAIIKQFNKLNEKEKSIAMLSLNLVQTVDKETINQASMLLNPNALKEVYLAVGSLVSKFCQQNGCNDGEVDNISKKFTESLKHCKVQTKKDEERILYILKGIGNTQHLASNGAVLAECVTTGRSNRIRVAALQAFSAASCDTNLQNKALELLANRNEDSEVRIEAFLVVIQCPSGDVANRIAEIVNSETVNQVGGFIESNLKAIRDSTDESKELQRRYLGNIRVTKKFPIDFRRYSFNNEVSYKIDALGLSASADYKLIYSQNGFLPRSARLNVKAEEFGINMNLLDASIRQENLENVLEYFLGPKGLINKDLGEILGKVEDPNGHRSRRSIADDTSKIAKKYKTYGAKNINDLNLDLSLKLFGSEMLFLSLGDNIPNTFNEITKEVREAFDKIKKDLNNFNKEFTSHTFFMDTEVIYPTSTGISLELIANGFLSTKAELGVSVDVENLMQSNWYNTKYKFKLIPSFDANVDVKIGFNAHVLSTGLRSAFSMHSATGSSIDLSITHEGSGFDVSIETPREKMELIDFKILNEFYIAEQDKPVKLIGLTATNNDNANPSISNCYTQFSSLGFEPCFVFDDYKKYHQIHFAAYVMTERQLNLKGYHKEQQEGIQEWKLDYSTPGSKESHDTSVSFQLGTKPRSYVRASLQNVNHKFAVEAGLNNDDNELIFYTQYEEDNKVRRSKVGYVKNGNEYRPVIEIQDANGDVSNMINGYHADGRVLVQQSGEQRRLNFDNLQISNKENDRIVVNGWADLGTSSLSTELYVAPNQNSYFVKSNLGFSNGEYLAVLFINDEKTPDNIYGASVNLQLGDQLINVELLGKFAKWEAGCRNEIQYVKQESSSSIASSKFTTSVDVKHKQNSLGSLKVHGETEGQGKLELNVQATSGKKAASVTVKYISNKNVPNNYQLAINAKLNQHFIDIVSKCEMLGNNFALDNVLTTSWGLAITLKGQLGQRYTPQDIYVDLQSNLQVSAKDKPYQLILKIIGTPDKTNSEFKASRDNAELIKILADTQHPQDKVTAGKVNIIIRNYLTAKGDFKISKNGKGEMKVFIEALKSEPKHKAEISSNFHIQPPKYDIEATLKLDEEQKLYIKSENNIDKLKFNTKSVIDVAKKKLLIDANGSIKGEYRSNGEVQGSFTATIPEGRVISGSLKRKINTNVKTGNAQGHVDIQLTDQLPNGGNKQSVIITGKLDKLNVKTKELSGMSQLIFTNFEGQTLNIDCHMKNLPKGHNKMIDFGYTVKGTMIKSPAECKLNIDEYSTRHAIFNIFGKYGDVVVANVNGNYNVDEQDGDLKYELHSDLHMPRTSFRTIDFTTKGQVVQPKTEGGNYILELLVDEKSGSEQFIKFEANIKSSKATGAFDINLETHKFESPLHIDGSYLRDYQGPSSEEHKSGNIKYNFNFKCADKFLKSSNDLQYNGRESITYSLTITSSLQAAKNIVVEIKGKLLDNEAYNLNILGNHNDHSYSLDSTIHRGSHRKGLQISATLPDRQPIKVNAIFEVIARRKAKLTMDLSNIIDLDLQFNSEAGFNAIDDFYIVAHWNSAKLKLENYEADIRTQGKVLTLLFKNAEGDILSGSATCVVKEESNKHILEGQGKITYKGVPHNANFHLTRQIYEMGTDKEIGFSYNFHGNFGPKKTVSTFKITNKDFNIKLSICEEKKQCTNVQILATNDLTQNETFEQSFLILLDMREIGFPYEFKLQSKNIRDGFKYQYMLDTSISSNNNHKYNLLVNIQPTNAKMQLKLPSREVLLEALQRYPDSGHTLGYYENSIAFYIDRINKPQDVTRFLASADLSGVERIAINAKALLKLEHPTVRPFTISGKLDANREQRSFNAEIVFDIFKLPQQKVVATSHIQNIKFNNGFNVTTSQMIHSTGLDFEYTLNSHIGLNTEKYEFSSGADLSLGNTDLKASAFVFSNKEHAEVLVYALNEEILKLIADFNKQKKSSKFNAKVRALNRKSIEIDAELQPTFAKLSVLQDRLITAQGEVKLGKELKFQIEGAGNELVTGRVGLDTANFLRTSYNTNEQHIKEFLNVFENEVRQDSELAQKLRRCLDDLKRTADSKAQLLKDSVPDFSQFHASYQNNLNEIVKELEADPAVKQISDALQTMFTKLSKLVSEFSELWGKTYANLNKTFVAIYEKIHTIFKETLIPAWEELVGNISKILRELRIELVDLFSRVLQSALETFKQYEPALKNYTKTIAEGLKPQYEAMQKMYKTFISSIEEVLSEWAEFWSKLPTFDTIQREIEERLQSLQLGKKLLEFLNNAFDQLHILPLTEESRKLVNRIHDYVVAKLKHQTINDHEVIEEIIKLFIKAIRSVWINVEINHPQVSGKINDLFVVMPLPSDLFNNLPALLTFRSSIFNFLINENWESLLSNDLWRSWLLFRDFDLKGHVADGRHIFTFDGLYVNFIGSCKYILAQDSVDNNFTVIAQVNNGKMKSIFLTNRDGQFMEVNDAGVLKINSNAVEFPHHENEMHAWRLFYTVHLLSEYGVHVTCTLDLKVCHFEVDGFYTSRMRGLLGNGNAEPYDDFIQIDGTITSDPIAFVNGYGLGKCNSATVNVQSEQTNTQRSEICNELFSYESTFAVGYLFVDSKPYRNACDNAVMGAAEKEREAAACSIALAYASALKLEQIFVYLPKRCLKCSGSAGQRELGDEFAVKIPTNKADLVFVVDIDVAPTIMTNLVAPVVSEIREILKSRGFTDIQIGVVAYSANQRYPALLTSDSGKLNYQGNLANVQLNGPKPIFELNISQMITEKKVNDIFDILESIIKSIVPQSDEEAYRLALNYPFRAGAAKSIVAVLSKNVEYDNIMKTIRAHVIGAVTQFDAALMHVIAPIKNVVLEGVPTEKIVGFNSRLVATLDSKDAKKRPKLQFHNDMGTNFVLNNGGWVFTTEHFEQIKPQDQKKALTQIVTSLADTLFKTEIVAECRCSPVHGIHAQHKCSTKSSNFVPNKKVKV